MGCPFFYQTNHFIDVPYSLSCDVGLMKSTSSIIFISTNMFVGVPDLPSYTLCSVEELLSSQEKHSASTQVSPSSPDAIWTQCANGVGRYSFNGRGRLILVTRDDREIVVLAVTKPNDEGEGSNNNVVKGNSALLGGGELVEVFAFDKNCYHVGYPLDMGDIEDIDVVAKGCGGFHVTCITCPLHNRIFDLSTGGLVTVAYDPSGVDTAPCLVRSGKRKGGAPSVIPCHQRVHAVSILEEGPDTKRIIVSDTFGFSNVSASITSNAESVQRDVALLSDKYNPVGSAEDFHEFNPKRGNSFVHFRPPEDQKRTSESTAISAGEHEQQAPPPLLKDVGSAAHVVDARGKKVKHHQCCDIS
jgi:nitrite reductase/ring-hydroxylating ferredoxin subunit